MALGNFSSWPSYWSLAVTWCLLKAGWWELHTRWNFAKEVCLVFNPAAIEPSRQWQRTLNKAVRPKGSTEIVHYLLSFPRLVFSSETWLWLFRQSGEGLELRSIFKTPVKQDLGLQRSSKDRRQCWRLETLIPTDCFSPAHYAWEMHRAHPLAPW